jgi:hypothetical protein
LKSAPSEDGYTLSGFDPPGFERFPDDVHKMYYEWIVELGLRAKDRDLAKGLDKDGLPFRPISEETRKRRRSAMTPSGKGDPNAPPLIPGWQKSRTRSLLTGKATASSAQFWWKFDPRTHDSWARILEYQRDNYGRDAFGLSSKAMARVRAQAWERWDKWKRGKYEAPAERERITPEPVRAGSYRTKHLDVMGGAHEIAKGQHAGFMTPEDWERYFRQAAKASLPGRPRNPKQMSPISGKYYTRGLQHDWARPGPATGDSGGTPTPTAAIPPKPGPGYRQRTAREPVAVPVGLVARVLDWIRSKTG